MHILITGATGGIGAATAEALAAGGADLTLIARDEEKLAALAERLARHGNGVAVVAGDLTLIRDFSAMIAEATSRLGPVDVLVNNAGVNWFGHFQDMGDADIARAVETNLLVPLRLTRILLGGMRLRGQGVIVNVGSVFGSIGFGGFVVYCASKFALRGFSEALRRELRGSGVSVVYVAPRFTRTALNEGAIERMAAGIGLAMDHPDRVAKGIAAAITARCSERTIGRSEHFFMRLNAMMPGMIDRGMVRMTKRILHFAPPLIKEPKDPGEP
jgi:short-subunit dehydrogenase